MSVERDDAVINQQLILRFGFRYDRSGSLFDPASVSKVEILDSDHTTVLETITVITRYLDSGKPKYKVVTSNTWNISSRKVYDRWYHTINGVDYELDSSTFIRSAVATAAGISSFVSLVKLKVQAPNVGNVTLVDPDDYETLIQEAIKEYSRRRPDLKVEKLAGDGNAYFSLPALWEDEFSQVVNIEYPLNGVPPYYIETKKYREDELDTGKVIRFYDSVYPGNAEDFLFRYSISRVVDDISSTVPVSDKDAVCNLASSLCCQALAEKFGQTSDSIMEADVVAYRTRGDEFASRAKDLRKLYENKIKPITTGVIGEWDMRSYWLGNRDMLNKRNELI